MILSFRDSLSISVELQNYLYASITLYSFWERLPVLHHSENHPLVGPPLLVTKIHITI